MRWRSHRRSVAVAAVAVAAVAFTFGFVRGGGPDGRSADPGPAPSEPARIAGEPARSDGDPPDGHSGSFDRSRQGAVEAAARLLVALDSPAFFDPARRAAIVERAAAAGARERLRIDMDAGAEILASQLGLTADVADDPGFVWRSVPAGWQVRQYRGRDATVALWGTGVVVSEGRQLDQPGWFTTEFQLRWERDDWRVVAMETVRGPHPPSAGTAAVSHIGRRIAEFEPFEVTVGATDG